jgi:hypothetical protein
MLDPDIGVLIVSGTVLLLASASLHKWRALQEFERVLAAYQLVSGRWLAPLARLLPTMELAIAVGLTVPATRPWSAFAGAALLLSYAGGIAINLRRNRLDLDCGCSGPGARQPIARWMVVRNVLLAFLLMCATAQWTVRPLTIPDWLTVGGGLTIVVLLYLATDRLLGQIVPRGAALRRPS